VDDSLYDVIGGLSVRELQALRDHIEDVLITHGAKDDAHADELLEARNNERDEGCLCRVDHEARYTHPQCALHA